MALVTIPVGSWNRFHTRSLSIEPTLPGFEHVFEYDGAMVRVTLPSSANVPSEPGAGDFLRFSSWTEIEGKKAPLQFWVESVDVTVTGTNEISLPAEIMEHPPKQPQLLSRAQQDELDGLVCTLGTLGEKAFDLWIRTLRWKTGNSSIGRPEIRGHGSGWATYLLAQPSGNRIWAGPVSLNMPAIKPVTTSTWDLAGAALETGQTPPVPVDFLMDAAEHLKLGDLQRATLETAMSCEVFLRTLLADCLPDSLYPSVSKYIDDANIRPVLTKFMQDVLSPEELKLLGKIKSKLHKLFDTRNDIVHKGRSIDLSTQLCNEFLSAAWKLIEIRT